MKVDKQALALVAWIYVAVGVVLSIAYLLSDDSIRDVISTLTYVMVVPAAIVALRIHGFPRSFIVAMSCVGILYLFSPVIAGFFADSVSSTVEVVIDLSANLVIITLVAFVVKRQRGRLDSGDILDGVIIAIGAWLVAWIALVEPFLSSSIHPPHQLVVNSLYVPATMPLLALMAAIVFAGTRSRTATWFLVAGLGLNVLGDLVYALEETRQLGAWAYPSADVMYVVAIMLTGAAFIHPSARDLITEAPAQKHFSLPSRVLITATALVVPVLLLGVFDADSASDRAVRSVSALALAALVGYRFYRATRAHLESQDHLLEAARTDALTSLSNKAAILAQASDIIDEVWRTDSQPALYLFDLDRFKNINDSLGHHAGDEVLQVIADRLELAATSIGATVGRPSGDEFVVLDPNPASPGQALAHAEVLHAVFKQPLSISDGVVFVTASAGVAAMPAGRPMSGEELFRWADIAMYRAKDAGRNCIALYHDSMRERVANRMDIETALHGALDRRELRLFHQPIVDIESGRVVGFEALMRWQRDDGSVLSPAEFIPIAEETGIITSLGTWALLEALTQLRTWTDDGVVPENATVSVNVSPRQLADPHFTDAVEEALQRSGLPPHLLWLEVTESVMISNPELARTTLQRIRAMGVRIALDDFGTGYSSLSLLQQFPLQRIKIDRTFVHGVASSDNDRSLVRTIIAMGDSMGLDVVAEGVESVQQLKTLRELGCAKAQGFLISHPVPAEAMRSTIAALESLAQWPEFAQLVGESPLKRSPIAGN